MRTTAQSDVGKLRKLIVKHVRDAFVDDATIDGQWQRLNYYGRPDLRRAVVEYDHSSSSWRAWEQRSNSCRRTAASPWIRSTRATPP